MSEVVAVYRAALYCEDCGREIAARLDRTDHPDTGDSGDYPQFMLSGETDSPSHCDWGEDCLNAEVLPSGRKVGKLLDEELTSYGCDYVMEAVEEEGGEVAELWRERWWHIF